MKYVLTILGILLIVASIFQSYSIITRYTELSAYGKGIIWGNALLFVVGSGLLALGIKRWQRKND